MTGCEDCLAALLDHDAFVLCRDFKGRTPIHFASACGHLEILRTLLQAALSTDPLDSVVDYSGYSPMHWASYSGKDLGWAPAHLCSALPNDGEEGARKSQVVPLSPAALGAISPAVSSAWWKGRHRSGREAGSFSPAAKLLKKGMKYENNYYRTAEAASSRTAGFIGLFGCHPGCREQWD